jgi:hypothetical protein
MGYPVFWFPVYSGNQKQNSHGSPAAMSIRIRRRRRGPEQPGESRTLVMFSRPVSTVGSIHTATADKDETLSYELQAVLFADGTFYGPDDVFADFSQQIYTARNFARDIQNLEDKYTALKQHEFINAIRKFNGSEASTDVQALVNRADVAFVILRIWGLKGEQEAEAALARLAALPDVTRIERQ